jgi:hypothetical protein
VQDTGNSPHRAWLRSDQSSAYDTESSKCNWEAVHSAVEHRGPDIPGNPPICKGRRIQRSSFFHLNFWSRNREQEQIKGSIQSFAEEKRRVCVAEFTLYGFDKIMGDAVSMTEKKAEITFLVAAQKL